jgi:phosphoribosylanthranilate isomerase
MKPFHSFPFIVMKNIIQIAGVRNSEEALLLASRGTDYIGFPLRLIHHPDDLCEKQAADIIGLLPATITPVLITYLNNAGEIRELANRLSISTVQLHGEIRTEKIVSLRSFSPRLHMIKSLIVGLYSLDKPTSQLWEMSPLVDLFITDTYDPRNGVTGATGKTHDWQISRRLVESPALPVILAGGLNPANVRETILTVKPFGVDVHTGVENEAGEKDPLLIETFISHTWQAFSEIR